jgi:hypothetical protein
MSLWKVYEVYDCSGNPVDGYEDCQAANQGFLSIRDDWPEGKIIEALAVEGHLTKEQVEAWKGNLILFDSDHGDGYELSEFEQAWAYMGGGLGPGEWTDYDVTMTAQQIAAAEELDYVEGMHELVAGNRPFMRIEPDYPDDEAAVFWRGKMNRPVPFETGLEAQSRLQRAGLIELRANPEKLTRKKRAGGGVLRVSVYVDGEFFGVRDFPDALEDEDPIGLAESGGTVSVTEAELGEMKVALDAFLDRGGEVAPVFLKVPGKEDAKFLFKDGELPQLVERDGVQNGRLNWDIDYTAADIRAIREDFRAWATRYVDAEPEAIDDYLEHTQEDMGMKLSKPQLEVLKLWYRGGLISGLAMRAKHYADERGDELLGEDESERTGAVDEPDEYPDFFVGEYVHTTMGVHRIGVVTLRFPWRESTDGTYSEPPLDYVPVQWDDGTRGYAAPQHIEPYE